MVLAYFRSGLDFVGQQSSVHHEWIGYLQRQMVANSNDGQHCAKSQTANQIPVSTSYRTVSPTEDADSTEWRFWKWIPPASRPQEDTSDDYGRLISSFKDYLHASEELVYSINELRQFTILEVSSIVGYVDDSVETCPDGGIRSYYIFKNGILPMWEDEYNAAGGCWTFRLVGRHEQPREMWKLLIRILSDARMKPYLEREICGAGLTVRRTCRHSWTYKVAVWNRDSENTIVKMMIGSVLQSLVAYPCRLFYYSHRTNAAVAASSVTRHSPPGRRLSAAKRGVTFAFTSPHQFHANY